jgi:hypothetical protein
VVLRLASPKPVNCVSAASRRALVGMAAEPATAMARGVPVRGLIAAHGEPAMHGWELQRTALRKVCFDGETPDAELDRRVAEFRDWLPRLIRYSVDGTLGADSAAHHR